MKYIKQFLIILAFCILGEILSTIISFPIPASIYGFVLLFIALCTGMLKPEHISQTADFLISIIGVFFVAPAVNIIAYYDVIAPALVPVCIIVVSSTFVVFGISGLVTQWVRRREDKKNG